MFKQATICALFLGLLSFPCKASSNELFPDYFDEGTNLLDPVVPEHKHIVADNSTVQANTISKNFKENPFMFISGMILMFVLIMVANAGGLSGAGTNIPVMLICFNMDMA